MEYLVKVARLVGAYLLYVIGSTCLTMLLIKVFPFGNMLLLFIGFDKMVLILVSVSCFYMISKRNVLELMRFDKYGELCSGAVYGACAMSFVWIAMLASGSGAIVPVFSFSLALATELLLFVLVAVAEELFFRGYVMRVIDYKRSPRTALLISSLIFAGVHISNDYASPIGIINIIIAGLLLGYMYLSTESLMMPIGFHLTWNYFQGCVFGINVSGIDLSSLLKFEPIGGTLLTGGGFGAEGSIFTSVVLLCILLVVTKDF